MEALEGRFVGRCRYIVGRDAKNRTPKSESKNYTRNMAGLDRSFERLVFELLDGIFTDKLPFSKLL